MITDKGLECFSLLIIVRKINNDIFLLCSPVDEFLYRKNIQRFLLYFYGHIFTFYHFFYNIVLR